MAVFSPRRPAFGELLRHLFLAWLAAALMEYLLVPPAAKALETMGAIAAMSFPRLLTVTALGTVLLWLGSCFGDFSRYERLAIPGVFLLLSAVTLPNSCHPAFLALCLLVFGILTVYGIWGHRTASCTPIQKSHWVFPVILAVLAAGMFVYLSIWTVCRYLTFSTPNFDFGIFSQMFHSMKTTGLPMTTVEREGLLSHFAVHVSPIYYLMLPFYCLFPDPATLQVLQAAVVCSAVIPLWLLGRHHGLSGLQRLLLCTLLLVLPAVGGGVAYDLHENCFLLPLVLWLLYAMDRRRSLLIGIFAILTLFVKEDAAIYVAVAGLYLTVRTALNRGSKKDLLTGLALLFGAAVYFVLVTGYLAEQGDGVMTYRYQNFMLDKDSSLFSVIVSVLLCPMKLLYECVDSEKLTYLLQTMLPLLGLPLITRKFERYLLLIPYILMNLMSDYQYQHDIFFQYNFGSTAFLLYLTAVNLADLRFCLLPLAGAVTAACLLFSGTVVPRVADTVALHRQYEGYYSTVRENLDIIPQDASVSSGTFYVAYLSRRAVLYDVRYSPMEQILTAEYIAVNKNSSDFKPHGGFERFAAVLEQNGYRVINNHPSIIIYQKTPN